MWYFDKRLRHARAGRIYPGSNEHYRNLILIRRAVRQPVVVCHGIDLLIVLSTETPRTQRRQQGGVVVHDDRPECLDDRGKSAFVFERLHERGIRQLPDDFGAMPADIHSARSAWKGEVAAAAPDEAKRSGRRASRLFSGGLPVIKRRDPPLPPE
jgi:hypothetical protein